MKYQTNGWRPPMMTKHLTPQTLLWLALTLALAGSLRHLAATFATIDGNAAMGWMQAVAIDAGVFALTYSIRARKAAKRKTAPIWIGVSLFTAISIYGNLAYGLLATTRSLPAWILASRPYVLAATLPVLVLYLAEILSDDRQAMAEAEARQAAATARQAAKTDGNTRIATPLDTANAERQAAKTARLAALQAAKAAKPNATITELAAEIGVSRATIRNYEAENGNHHNGNRKIN